MIPIFAASLQNYKIILFQIKLAKTLELNQILIIWSHLQPLNAYRKNKNIKHLLSKIVKIVDKFIATIYWIKFISFSFRNSLFSLFINFSKLSKLLFFFSHYKYFIIRIILSSTSWLLSIRHSYKQTYAKAHNILSSLTRQ